MNYEEIYTALNQGLKLTSDIYEDDEYIYKGEDGKIYVHLGFIDDEPISFLALNNSWKIYKEYVAELVLQMKNKQGIIVVELSNKGILSIKSKDNSYEFIYTDNTDDRNVLKVKGTFAFICNMCHLTELGSVKINKFIKKEVF